MSKSVLLGPALIVLVATTGDAYAQFFLGAGIEYFHWREDTQPIEVKESGPRAVFTLGYTQPRASGLLFAYRGRAYAGEVDYDGALLFSPSVPVHGNTRYFGSANEAQLRYRFGAGFDLLAAAGLDIWRRELSANQKEDYYIGFARLGAEYNAIGPGWTAGAGLKYPFWTHENAHFTDLGYDQNPALHSGKDISGYGQIGYRFAGHWAVLGYGESYRFKQSSPVFVTNGSGTGAFVQPATDTYVLGVKVEYTF
jgi:hypothetical protein